ncbi:MAG: nuclear transport factor 2 family protein [Bacteroidota bacterium]
MTKAEQRAIIEKYVEAYNRFDISGMLRDLHEEVVFQNISGGEVNLKTEGKTAFREQAEAAKHYFSERRQTITNWEYVSPDLVRIGIAYRGVLAVDLPNGMKAGELLELTGSSVFQFRRQQIIGIVDES